MNGKERGISGRGNTWSGHRPTVYSDGRKEVGKGYAFGRDSEKLLIDDLDSALDKVAEAARRENAKIENIGEYELTPEDISESLKRSLAKNNITIEWGG